MKDTAGKLAAAFVAAVVVVTAVYLMSCATPAVLTPPRNDYPCGRYHAHLCSLESGGGCCDEEEICGHDNRIDEDPMNSCPVKMCCYVGPGQDTAPPPVGAECSGYSCQPKPQPPPVHGRIR